MELIKRAANYILGIEIRESIKQRIRLISKASKIIIFYSFMVTAFVMIRLGNVHLGIDIAFAGCLFLLFNMVQNLKDGGIQNGRRAEGEKEEERQDSR